jgi:hypothetical protein
MIIGSSIYRVVQWIPGPVLFNILEYVTTLIADYLSDSSLNESSGGWPVRLTDGW